MTAATMLAAKSEIGMLIHIPFEPQNMGKIMMQGNRKSNWRVRDRKIALDAIPILWKKVGSNHLKTDNGEKHDYDTQSGGRTLNQSFVGGKGGYSQFGHQFAYKESAGGDKGGSVDGQF